MAEKRLPGPVVEAAGTLPWRRRGGRLEVALVHRPRYDDWSWPKGKLDPGEERPVAAVRETWEETGLRVRLGRPLPTNSYAVSRRTTKEVHYWTCEVTGGKGLLENEIDEVRWLTPPKARQLLTSSRDRRQIDALATGPLPTRTIMIVRHAHAVPRKEWRDDDRLRPLDAAGRTRAAALRPVLAAYGITDVVCSTSTRCVDTVRPYLKGTRIRTTWSDALSEEGYAESPKKLRSVVDRGLRGGEAVAFCSHGPVLVPLVDEITRRFRTPGKDVKRTLRAVRRDNLDKGEALVLHVDGGKKPALLAVERHRAASMT